MFERRLKIFLMLLFAVTGVLVLRAAQVQVVQREEWREKAALTMMHSRSTETIRGNIVDFKDRIVAMDRPCIDACIDFRALTDPPEPKWVRAVALERLISLRGEAYKSLPRAKRIEALNAEVAQVEADIRAMWDRLADVSGVPREKILETRAGIVHKVMMRRRAVWYRNYHQAVKEFAEREPAPAWRRWLVDEAAEAPQEEDFAKLVVAEELQDHPVLKAVDNPVQNELRKHIEDYPGLELRPGTERHYPFMDAGCHLLGSLARVDREDLKKDPNLGKDERRQYYPNDLIGRGGIEGLAEPLLRGSRGKIVTIEGVERPEARIEPEPGRNVKLSIDFELQKDIMELFGSALVLNEFTNPKSYDKVEMHGGVVVLDVKTGAVRALVSAPTFDLNQFDEKYDELVADELNLPLLNRATQVAREPGSTVKPVVGLAGIAQGVVGVNDGIECTGFMEVNGRRFSSGKCWTQGMFNIGHHQVPYKAPHVDGHLTFADAVERSCNVYFETVGDRLRMDGLSQWYTRFGLGRRTGLGIPEVAGSLPSAYKDGIAGLRFATWISSIGQGTTLATPVQMANVAATIARDGVWMRPRLLEPGQDLPAPDAQFGPDRVDLGLPRAAVLAAQEGMRRVVNNEAGTGKQVRRDDLVIAGKTGTAQAARIKVKVRDKSGKEVLDAKGNPKMEFLHPSSPLSPNLKAPWYRGFGKEGTDLKHSWYIGFAPADNPKIAFAVMLEYGGSGGTGAGLIAKDVINLLVERGYLEVDPRAKDRDGDAQPAAAEHAEAAAGPELLVND